MRAVGVSRFGGPEVLHLVELPDPHPGRGEVRVRVRTAGVNPADVLLRDGSLAQFYAGLMPPFIPGMDIAGTIDEVGEALDPGRGLAVGQDVVGVVDNHGSHGGYSQYVCLPAASVIPVPRGATFPAAASFLMNALTARNALDALSLPRGATVLVTGAAGAVGAYTVALAHDEGLRVAAIARPEDASFLRSAGAAGVIARGDQSAEHVREAFPEGVDAIVDAASLGDRITPALRDHGKVVLLRSWEAVGSGRGIEMVHVNVRQRVTDHAAIARIGEQVSARLLALRVAAILPAAEAAAAHQRLAEGGLRGRIVLDFDQPAL